MSIKFFELEDGVECEVEFEYRPGAPATFWDPAEDGEVITETSVRIYIDGKPSDQVLAWDEFIERLATDRGVDKDRAAAQVLAELAEDGELALVDAYDDYDEDDDYDNHHWDDEWSDDDMSYDVNAGDDL